MSANPTLAELDQRIVLVKRTVEGALFVERVGDAIIAKA